jgi:hypothetical protein
MMRIGIFLIGILAGCLIGCRSEQETLIEEYESSIYDKGMSASFLNSVTAADSADYFQKELDKLKSFWIKQCEDLLSGVQYEEEIAFLNKSIDSFRGERFEEIKFNLRELDQKIRLIQLRDSVDYYQKMGDKTLANIWEAKFPKLGEKRQYCFSEANDHLLFRLTPETTAN